MKVGSRRRSFLGEARRFGACMQIEGRRRRCDEAARGDSQRRRKQRRRPRGRAHAAAAPVGHER
eukprot:2964359-Rhodomonas_salina.2